MNREQEKRFVAAVKRMVVTKAGPGRFQTDATIVEDISPVFARLLAKSGKTFRRADEVLKGGGSSDCHNGSMRYVKAYDGATLWSGLALTRGMWVVHSWVMDDDDGDLIETTPFARDRYFGVAIDTQAKFKACYGRSEP